MPSFVTINPTRVAPGSPISTDFGNDVITDLNYLNNNLASSVDAGGAPLVVDGSFEIQPNGTAGASLSAWAYVAGTGGTGFVINSDQNHGAQCFQFSQPNVGGNTGGTLTSASFMNVSPSAAYDLTFMVKCSQNSVEPKVQINWYTSSGSPINTTTVYDATGTTAPTTWKAFKISPIVPPATAVFAKIVLVGGTTSQIPPVSATINFDGISMIARAPYSQMAIMASTANFTVPSGVYRLLLQVNTIGGFNLPGYGTGFMDVSPGDIIAVNIPAPKTDTVQITNQRSGVVAGITNGGAYGLTFTFNAPVNNGAQFAFFKQTGVLITY